MSFCAIFKAKELKFVLFYLSPVAFPPFFHGEDRVSDEIDLKKLVFATRSLFDTIADADFATDFWMSSAVAWLKKRRKWNQ